MFDPEMNGAFRGAGFIGWLRLAGFAEQAADVWQGTLTAEDAAEWLVKQAPPLPATFPHLPHDDYVQPPVVNVVATSSGRILDNDAGIAFIAAGHPVQCRVSIDRSDDQGFDPVQDARRREAAERNRVAAEAEQREALHQSAAKGSA